MSFKDDFVEALRSVKRDFSRDEYPEAEQENSASPAAESEPDMVEPTEYDIPAAAAPEPDEDVLEAYRNASAQEDDEDVYDAEDYPETAVPSYPTAYGGDYAAGSSYSKPDASDRYEDRAAMREAYTDYTDSGMYDDEKTVISRNTIIRGNMETQDSIRLLGQVLGDIDCKSNIVVAGKVRGNTSAANAYIFDAQVDGDVRCDDVITISNDAWVLGNLRAQQAEIDGKVKGNMEVRYVVSIGASSSILGDISTDELEIKRGAFVNGRIMMYSPSRDVLDRFDRFGE